MTIAETTRVTSFCRSTANRVLKHLCTSSHCYNSDKGDKNGKEKYKIRENEVQVNKDYMNKGNKLFELLKQYGEGKTVVKKVVDKKNINKYSKSDDREDKLNISGKMEDLMKAASVVPLQKQVKNTTATVKKKHADKEYGKKFDMAMNAAKSLKTENKSVDIEKTANDLIKAMNIERGTIFKRKIFQPWGGANFQRENTEVVLSTANKLGIFSCTVTGNDEPSVLQNWDKLEKMTMMNLLIGVPKNYFDELIMWTQEGKIWHFPIDNEQGLDDEKKVDFSEHVFLDKHLDPWCPKVGPIRHFMELVTVGLSKNPYLTVEKKVEHIMWYKNYFDSKKQLLENLGVMNTEGSNTDSKESATAMENQ